VHIFDNNRQDYFLCWDVPPGEIVLLDTSNSTYIEPFGACLPNASISAGFAT